MDKVPNPEPCDSRINDSPDFRAGYAEGFLDCLGIVTHLDAEGIAALSSIAARRRTLTEAELNVLRAAGQDDGGFADRFLERQRQQGR